MTVAWVSPGLLRAPLSLKRGGEKSLWNLTFCVVLKHTTICTPLIPLPFSGGQKMLVLPMPLESFPGPSWENSTLLGAKYPSAISVSKPQQFLRPRSFVFYFLFFFFFLEGEESGTKLAHWNLLWHCNTPKQYFFRFNDQERGMEGLGKVTKKPPLYLDALVLCRIFAFRRYFCRSFFKIAAFPLKQCLPSYCFPLIWKETWNSVPWMNMTRATEGVSDHREQAFKNRKICTCVLKS